MTIATDLSINAIDDGASSLDGQTRSPVRAAVQAIHLSKRYGTFAALTDLSLSIAEGQVFGLLGPNGAGKTTFLRTLLGFLFPTGGHVQVMGIDPVIDPVGVRQLVSYLPGDARLPREMRGHGVLRFFTDMQVKGDLKRSLQIADRLDLDLRRFVGFMSTGMRQKLAIAAVMGSHAPLLILDEPTANLDPTVRGDVLAMVQEAKAEGRTVIFSSHVLSEIEDVCDCVAFLRQGRLAREQSLDSLKQRHRIVARLSEDESRRASQFLSPSRDAAADVTERLLPTCLELPDALKSLVASVAIDRDRITIDTSGDLSPLLTWLNQLNLTDMRVEAFGLRAVYDSIHRGGSASEVSP